MESAETPQRACRAWKGLLAFAIARIGLEGLLVVALLLCVRSGNCRGLHGIVNALGSGRIVAATIALGLLATTALALYMEEVLPHSPRYAPLPVYGASLSLLGLALAAGGLATHMANLIRTAVALHSFGLVLCIAGFAGSRRPGTALLGLRGRLAEALYVLQGIPLIGPLASSLLVALSSPECRGTGPGESGAQQQEQPSEERSRLWQQPPQPQPY